MATTPTIVTGDDISVVAPLKRNGVPFEIDMSSGNDVQISAMLVSSDHKKSYMVSAVEQSPSSDGADWENGIVVIEFSKEDTVDVVFQGSALVEIQVSIDGKAKTWFAAVNIITGRIA